MRERSSWLRLLVECASPTGLRHNPYAGTAVWLAITAIVLEVVGLAVPVPDLAGAGVVVGICVLVLSRAVRRRAVAESDAAMASTGRFAQVLGWLSVAPVIALSLALLILVVVLSVLFRP